MAGDLQIVRGEAEINCGLLRGKIFCSGYRKFSYCLGDSALGCALRYSLNIIVGFGHDTTPLYGAFALMAASKS